MIRRFLQLAVLLVGVGGIQQTAQANSFCDMDTALAAYKAAYNREKRGDLKGAFRTFEKLAQAGVAAAQRHVATFYLEESRDKMALEKAIMWSQLAAWGGDRDSEGIVKRAVDAARYQVAETGLSWARDWRPQAADCDVSGNGKQADDDFQVAGRFPVIRQEKVDEDLFAAFVTRLQAAIENVDQVAPYFAPLVELIPAFEVIEGKEADRYIAWDEDNDWVQVSSGFLQDDTARQLAYSLILTVQRRLFAGLKDAEFHDQIATHYGKIKIFGSLYGDVETKRFLGLMSEAIKEARNLPLVLRDKVNFLDEIYYMPPSKYHRKRFLSKQPFAVYDDKRSHGDKRMMIVTHEIAFETPKQLILELVRVGDLAQQHAQIEGVRGQAEGKQREQAILKALEGNLVDLNKAFSRQMEKNQELVKQWDEKGPDGIKEVYCASVFSQAKAAIALKVNPIEVSRTVEFRNCKKARKAWQSYRSEKAQK